VATLHIHTTGHWPQLLSHFTAPAHPPCSARSRPGTVGVICVTLRLSQTAAVRHIDRACIRFFKLRARTRARAPRARPRRHAVAARCESNHGIECVTGPRTDTWRTIEAHEARAKLDAAGTKRDQTNAAEHVGIFLIYSDTRKLLSSQRTK
jgi:hypothetical protein